MVNFITDKPDINISMEFRDYWDHVKIPDAFFKSIEEVLEDTEENKDYQGGIFSGVIHCKDVRDYFMCKVMNREFTFKADM